MGSGKNEPVRVAQARPKYHFAPASNIIRNQMVKIHSSLFDTVSLNSFCEVFPIILSLLSCTKIVKIIYPRIVFAI